MEKKVVHPVDEALSSWGDRFFNSGPVNSVGAAANVNGYYYRPKSNVGAGSISPGHSSKQVRSKLGSIAKRSPEVMVKISGGGKGMSQIKDHLDYISRNGRIDLEDQDGNKLEGVDDLRGLKDEWRYGGYGVPDSGDRKEAFNIVLSMPAGTDPEAVKRAARDFASRQFSNHQYVMALHTKDTDPDPEPSPNPHVHLCVKATSFDGRRLNPRKADLQLWREGFAEALRENGIEASATNRQQRLKRERGDKQSVYQIKKRGSIPRVVGKGRATPERVLKAKQTEEKILSQYRDVTKILAKSDSSDRALAVSLVRRLDEQMRVYRPESERGADPRQVTGKNNDLER